MIDKRYLHHLWTRIRPVKTWYLLAAFLLTAVVCVFALRTNNTNMVALREAVYEADQNGGNVEAALQELRAYVASHMNTNLDAGRGVYPPIQLKHTYERLVQDEQQRVQAANARIYTDAQRHCETINSTSILGRDRLPCIEQYIKSQGVQTAKSVPDALYKFDFVSPRWSPDLAGWTLVLSVVLLVLALIRFALGRWLRSATK